MKMEKFFVFLVGVIVNFYVANAAVLLWSNKVVQVSPLESFTDEDLEKWQKTLNNPKLFIFEDPEEVVSPAFGDAIRRYYKTYNINGELRKKTNVISLSGNPVLDKAKIQETLDTVKESEDFLAVIYSPKIKRRYPRDADNNATSEVTETYRKAEGAVFYGGKSNKDLYSMLYSSRPLLLKINNTKEYLLGKTSPDMVTVDTRLNVNIPLEDGDKITLRFSFLIQNGYWYLTGVKITDTESDMNFNLSVKDVFASTGFSYHCSGETVFVDKTNNVELYAYDLQVETESRNEKFSSANDCVTFTTVPIWSGIFVTSILGAGLVIALSLILDIKTMDKFDNAKTKNLSITVFE